MKKKSNIALLIILLALLTLACTFPGNLIGIKSPVIEKGSGNVIRSEPSIAEFRAIKLTGGGELRLVQGSEYHLIIEAEDNILPHLTVELNGNTLNLGYEESLWKDRYVPTKPIIYTVTFSSLEEIILLGGAKITAGALDVPALSINLNGGMDLTMLDVYTDKLDIQLDGGANVKLSGEVGEQALTLNGAGAYSAEDLKSRDAKVVINGAGDAKVWATETLDVSLNGFGSVSYYGSPQVTQSLVGLGTITSLGEK
ncbi:MAG: head GIN domain-containing protein [Anaerolineaceae bacterium]